MRFLKLKLTGYAGIADGLGLNVIDIDYSKSKNLICLIGGKNGSGKSTINMAQSPLPDPSSSFVQGMYAEKEEVILDGDTMYHILIVHDIDGNGNRKQAKAFIQKNGEELNPNGNITSYKDTVCSEFDLDPNFMSLTRLASDDRGLADKKPAERKKYVSAIIDSLETYNGIYKTLSKKASIFKSHINSLSSKISSIGDIESAKINLQALDNRILSLESHQRELQDEISKKKAVIDSIDPDGTIQNQYEDIATSISMVNEELSSVEKRLNSISAEYNIDYTKIDELITVSTKKQNDVESSISEYKMRLRNLIDDSAELSKSIQSKNQKVESMKSDFDYDNLVSAVERYTNIVDEQETILKDCGLYGVDVSKEEYLLIFTSLKRYRESINAITESLSTGDIEVIADYLGDSTKSIYYDERELENYISTLKDSISSLNEQLSYYRGQLENTLVLSKRPKNCKIDSCEFINKALKSLKEKPQENIDRIESEIEQETKMLKESEEKLNHLKLLVDKFNVIVDIVANIASNTRILNKFPVSYIFTDKDEFLKRFRNRNSFNEVEDCDKYIMLADSIEGYKENKSTLNNLIAELKVHENKNQIIDELISEINELNDKLLGATNKIEEINKSISFNTGLLEQLEKSHRKLLEVSDLAQRDNELLAQKAQIKEKFISIKDNISKIKSDADKINSLYQQYNMITVDLTPIKKDRDDLSFSIKMAEEYQHELDEYQEKYNTVEVLKKYSSPSSGIQTVYMNVYMNKTLELANELLMYLFDGELELLPYVINADEFRIPVKHASGMISDDISSCSNAQICMISMVVSLSLLIQASSKFNIIRFDEIDGALDTANRLKFANVLRHIGSKLGIEQIIMVSHSIEIDLGQVDVVKLILPEGCGNTYDGANIIYDYSKEH